MNYYLKEFTHIFGLDSSLYRISFSVPWLSDALMIAAILLVCMTAPVVIYNRTQTDSIVQRLRSGEE